MTDFAGRTGLVGATVIQRDGTVSLDGITVLAEPGELLAVLGPSGSGKSTLLRAIAGLIKLRAGSVVIAGEPTTADPAFRDVAMVFEKTQLVPTLDVAKNMGMGLKLRHTPAAEVERQVGSQARRLRVSRLLRRMPTELSAGQQGQVGIGRALVRTPKVFLLDEPLAHVDAHERARMRRLIAESVAASSVSTIYVTHDQTDALAIGRRIVVLNAGRVAQIAAPRELYDRPADLFVADFIGTTALGRLKALVVTANGLCGYQVGDRVLPTWQPLPAGLVGQVGREVVLGLRAEHVHDPAVRADADHVQLTGSVTSIDRTGRDAYLTVEVQRQRVVARFPGAATARVGDTVRVAVDAERALVFDPVTGAALHHPAR